jgi:two-component system chemotaxis response regulator CheY
MGITVLIVDDSPLMRKMVKKVLTMSGVEVAEVHEAGDGVEALAALERAAIGLALVDVNMPNMNGDEFLEAVRAHAVHSKLPVVMVSTEGSEARIEKFRSLGAGFVRKPFTPEALAEAIQSATQSATT